MTAIGSDLALSANLPKGKWHILSNLFSTKSIFSSTILFQRPSCLPKSTLPVHIQVLVRHICPHSKHDWEREKYQHDPDCQDMAEWALPSHQDLQRHLHCVLHRGRLGHLLHCVQVEQQPATDRRTAKKEVNRFQAHGGHPGKAFWRNPEQSQLWRQQWASRWHVVKVFACPHSKATYY